MKKFFIISAILLGITILFLIVYNFAFKKEIPISIQKEDPLNIVNDNKKTKPNIPEKIINVSGQAILSPVFDKKTETIIYYSEKDGTIWSINANGGSKKQIEETSLPGLQKAIWSPNHSSSLLTIKKNNQDIFYMYDYLNKKEVFLKSGLDSANWDNLGAKIFYKYYDSTTSKRSLNIANPDGSEWQKLSDIEYRYLSIAAVPLTSMVSFWNSPNAKEKSKLQIVGAAGGQAQTIMDGVFGGDYLWSPDGTQALVSSLSGKNEKMVTLGIVKINGEYQNLNVPTMVSKCVWSSDGKIIYYALPGGIPEGVIMPNDYQEKKFMTEDTFWKMDIQTGQKTRLVEVADISEKYDSGDLFLSATQGALYFINRRDSNLYRLDL